MGQFNYRMVWPMLYNLDNLTDKPMRLQIGVYDFDLGKDDLIGETQLNIDDMLSAAFKNRERNRFIQVGQMPNPDPNPNPNPDPSPSPRPSPNPNPNPTPNPTPNQLRLRPARHRARPAPSLSRGAAAVQPRCSRDLPRRSDPGDARHARWCAVGARRLARWCLVRGAALGRRGASAALGAAQASRCVAHIPSYR